MKKIIATMLVTLAALGISSMSIAATSEAKANYNAAKDSAKAEYKIAQAKCDALTGNPKDVCKEEAKATRDRAEAEAKAQYKGTLSARTSARKKIAEADYDVAHEKCEALTGNDKDVCIKEAKAAQVAAKADAKADKKVIEARNDARNDKIDAEYKVAKEKCDALAGASKDSCMADTKAKFGK